MLSYVIKVIICLLIIGYLIYGTNLTLKWLTGSTKQSTTKNIKVVERMQLSKDSWVVIANIQNKTYLLGLSSGGINMLTPLEDFKQETSLEVEGDSKFARFKRHNFESLLVKGTRNEKKIY